MRLESRLGVQILGKMMGIQRSHQNQMFDGKDESIGTNRPQDNVSHIVDEKWDFGRVQLQHHVLHDLWPYFSF